MCRSLKVLCVAEDHAALAALKRATVSAQWELAPGATSDEEAVRQLHEDRPHVLVVFGSFERFVANALESYPSLRVIADHEMPGASVTVASRDDVRDAVLGRPRTGPVL